MADVKISQLPAATSVVAGTDVAPLVSGGVTTKATPQQIVNSALAAGVTGSTAAGTSLVTFTQTGDGYAILVEDATSPDSTPFCVHASGGASLGNTTDPGASSLFASGSIAAGNFVTAVTAFTGTNYRASGSGGGVLQSNNSTACLQWGAGGGSNVTFDGGFSASADDAAITINPQKTGTVTIAPATAGTINNMAIGTVTPLAVNATALTASSSLVTNGASVEFKGLTGGKTVSIAGAGGTGDPILTISVNDAADATLLVPSVLGSTNSGTLIVDVGDASVSSWTFSGGDLFPSQGAKNMTNGFVHIPGASGEPTGTPATDNAGITPLYYDESNNRLYAYNSGWQYTSMAPSYITTEAGTSRTLTAADNNKVIYCTSGSAVTITTASGLGANFNCTIIQGGAGKVTVAQGASTTLVSYSSLFSTMGQYAVISLITPVADTFVAAGNLGV